MAQVPDQTLIAALDIGSSKVSAMIARQDGEGRLTVLGTGQRESRGVKRGFITDMAASEFAVREAVELAERMSGLTVDDVWASYGAGGLVSDLANVEVELGGLMAYAYDIVDLFRRAAGYVDEVLKGAKPGDIPIYQAAHFQLVINVKAAKAIGLTIPPSLLLRADEVIE